MENNVLDCTEYIYDDSQQVEIKKIYVTISNAEYAASRIYFHVSIIVHPHRPHRLHLHQVFHHYHHLDPRRQVFRHYHHHRPYHLALHLHRNLRRHHRHHHHHRHHLLGNLYPGRKSSRAELQLGQRTTSFSWQGSFFPM